MSTVEFTMSIDQGVDRIERGLVVSPGLICAPAVDSPWAIYHHVTGLAVAFFNDAEACAAAGREVGAIEHVDWLREDPVLIASDEYLQNDVERIVRKLGGWITNGGRPGRFIIRNEVTW